MSTMSVCVPRKVSLTTSAVFTCESLREKRGKEVSHCFRWHLISSVIVESVKLCESCSLCWQPGRCRTLLNLQAADVSPSRNVVGFFFPLPSLFIYFSFCFLVFLLEEHLLVPVVFRRRKASLELALTKDAKAQIILNYI